MQSTNQPIVLRLALGALALAVLGACAGSGEADGAKADTVGLRQRVWPLVEAIKRAQAAGEPLVWGV